MLLAEKSPEIFPRRRGCYLFQNLFLWSDISFLTWTNKNYCLHYNEDFSFLFDLQKLTEYWASAVNVVSSNFYVGSIPRIKISFFLLSMLMSSYKLRKERNFFPNQKMELKKLNANRIQYNNDDIPFYMDQHLQLIWHL